MYFIRTVIYLILPFLFTLVSIGKVVSVDKVKFTSLQDDWLMSEVRISTGINTLPGATSKNFVENVVIRLYLGFITNSLDNDIDFYYSEVTASILERGDKNSVRFFIPGKVMEMKRYRKPEYYYAEIVVNQSPVEPQPRAYSSRFQSKDSLKNFIKKAETGSVKNLGRLMPSYLSPVALVGSDKGAPIYLRIKN